MGSAASAIAFLALSVSRNAALALLVTGRYGCFHRIRSPIRVARGERRVRIVLDTELDRLSHGLAGNLGHNSQTEVDTGRNASRRDHVAVLNYAGFFVRCADQGQKFRIAPVRRCAAALE